MKKRDKTIIAGTAAALAVAGAGGALAASDALSLEDRNQAVIDDAAKQLGVEPSELSDALRLALKNRIDDAVDAGRLTEEQGKALKERLDETGAPLVFGGFGRGLGDHVGPGPFGFGHFGHLGKLEAAASYLGLSDDELRERLADGKSLADIAKAEGKSVDGLVQALVTDAEKRIDDAVDAGRLTPEQASQLKEGLAERMRDHVEREYGWRRAVPGHRFGPKGAPDSRFRPRFGRFEDEPQDFGGSAA
jgi:polyhydroxyalkanoate synthesis regulator phasin